MIIGSDLEFSTALKQLLGMQCSRKAAQKTDGNTAADEDLQIHFIDVGQGDSILIVPTNIIS